MSGVHTPAGERQYACSYCPKTFGRLEHQKRHELIHTAAKPYHCSFCPKDFIRK